MRTTCFGQKRYIYIYICVLQIDQPIPPWKASQTGFHVFKVFPRNTHLSPEGFQHQQWSCRTRFCGYRHSVFQLSAESRHVCIRFARAWFQLKGERMRDTSMQQKIQRRHATKRYNTHGNRMVPCAMARAEKKISGECSALCSLCSLCGFALIDFWETSYPWHTLRF